MTKILLPYYGPKALWWSQFLRNSKQGSKGGRHWSCSPDKESELCIKEVRNHWFHQYFKQRNYNCCLVWKYWGTDDGGYSLVNGLDWILKRNEWIIILLIYLDWSFFFFHKSWVQSMKNNPITKYFWLLDFITLTSGSSFLHGSIKNLHSCY